MLDWDAYAQIRLGNMQYMRFYKRVYTALMLYIPFCIGYYLFDFIKRKGLTEMVIRLYLICRIEVSY